MSVRIYPSGRVKCTATIDLPLSAGQAWGQIRDFHQYGAHDHFHAGFAIDGGVPKAGAAIQIEHCYGPLRLRRVGKILRWREHNDQCGERCSGFAFSDLSAVASLRRFPHIFSMRLRPSSPQRCALTIQVTGRWTAATPRWVAWLWLTWVFVPLVQSVRNRLLEFAAFRNRG